MSLRNRSAFWSGLRAKVTRAFFANFFRLLLAAVVLSEWCVLWWILSGVFGPLPLVSHVLGLTGFSWLAIRAYRYRPRQNAPAVVSQLHHAFAFTCLFCTAYLLLVGSLWMVARVFLQALTVEARTLHAALFGPSSLDVGFRWLADAGMVLIAAAFAYGYTIGQQRLRVTHLTLPLRGLPIAVNGWRIAQISDIHIGSYLDAADLERFVERVNALNADVICITGDIVHGRQSPLEDMLPILAQLRAVQGVFAILGNHDHFAGANRVEAALRRLTPFTVLRDQTAVIRTNGQRIHVVGLDDRGRDWARGVNEAPYLAAALAAIPAEEPVLLLSHRPDVFPQAAAGGVALMLSGHTHGGQLGVPWLRGRVRNLAEFITRFDRGLFEQNGSYLYVNSGLGVTGQRIRLWTPREITLIEVQNVAVQRCAA